MIEGERIEREQRKLMVKLTDDERMAKGQALARAAEELATHHDEAKSVKASLKATETAIVARIGALALVVRQGAELRDVNVFGIADIPNGRVRYYREDTEEFLSDRAIKMDERQTSIPGTNAPTGPTVLTPIDGGKVDEPQAVKAACGHVTPFTGDPSPALCNTCKQATEPKHDPVSEEVQLERQPAMVNVTAGCGHQTEITPDQQVPIRCGACAIEGDENYTPPK